MRARWLKPDFFTDKKIATLSPETALVFQALWVWADDGGVCICDPDYLKSQAFHRWQIFTIDGITRSIRELSDLKRIAVYRVGDDYFAEILHWKRHQAVHKPSKFRHPRRDEQLTLSGDQIPGTVSTPVPHQSQIRQLDSKTARHLDGVVAEEPARNPPGNPSPKLDDNIVDNIDSGGSLRFRELSRKLESDLDRDALAAMVRAVPEPASWTAEARASLDGIHGPPLSPRQLGEALREYVGNGNLKTPNFKHFRRYLETAAKTPGSTNGPRRSLESGNGRSPDTGEAMTILTRIKALREVSNPQAGGQVERISRSAVEAMGPDVWAAYQSIGGADAILKGEPSKWGFLVRDFAVALNYARDNPQGVE